MSIDQRIEELEARVDELERQFDDLLRVFSETGALTPDQRKALNRKLAARARASKPVGEGQGAVRTASTRRRLNQEAQDD